MNAYSELYLADAKLILAQCFSYLIDDCGIAPHRAWEYFRNSGYAEAFERGTPGVIFGISGIELAEKILIKVYGAKDIDDLSFVAREAESAYKANRTPAYWAGWAIAEYQWYTGRRFKDIFSAVSLDEIIKMYMPFHEMDISHFIEAVDDMIMRSSFEADAKLKVIRERRGLSQAELADRSGVKLRSVQMYEQKQNNIDKAQASTLYKLSVVLGCSIEDLLEDPSV